MATAQESFRDLVRDHLAPALRSMGFKGSGQEFLLPDDRHWALLGIQRSRWSDSNDLELTIQLTVASRRVWEQLSAQHDYGERPHSTRFYGPRIWQKRLGELMPESRDKWWHVSPDCDTRALGAELAAAVERFALPAMRPRCRPTGLSELGVSREPWTWKSHGTPYRLVVRSLAVRRFVEPLSRAMERIVQEAFEI